MIDQFLLNLSESLKAFKLIKKGVGFAFSNQPDKYSFHNVSRNNTIIICANIASVSMGHGKKTILKCH